MQCLALLWQIGQTSEALLFTKLQTSFWFQLCFLFKFLLPRSPWRVPCCIQLVGSCGLWSLWSVVPSAQRPCQFLDSAGWVSYTVSPNQGLPGLLMIWVGLRVFLCPSRGHIMWRAHHVKGTQHSWWCEISSLVWGVFAGDSAAQLLFFPFSLLFFVIKSLSEVSLLSPFSGVD